MAKLKPPIIKTIKVLCAKRCTRELLILWLSEAYPSLTHNTLRTYLNGLFACEVLTEENGLLKVSKV